MFQFITNFIYQPLLFLTRIFGGNLGLSIIALTVLIKVILLPLVIPTIKSAKKMQDLKPALDKLKAKHSDKAKLQQAQLELYKQNGINPAAGCLPQIVQIIVLIALYQVFMKFLGQPEIEGVQINFKFLYLNLNEFDPYYIMPVLAGVTQFVFSLMMQSGLESHVHNPKTGTEKKKEEDNLEMAASMQTQMVYMMPIMTTVISIKFDSGLVLYWVVSTLFSIVQQYYFSGWGGLIPFLKKIKIIKVNK